ncbi:methyl-accepting chemotaxis protein [Rhizobium leguminosarum]|uniref:methyl-accepting chemotaxis protein n=1 Tax=Rhizobium leguminosarum TaxID=384 RepID=UPI00143F6F2A|nr:methyl-accepting chemotaxis protein [Rhizobium leguminosarum]NKL82101.1 methyl-accepting chemotaxis protein [Rhizobium leguminosarum bv. viciae]
MSTSSMRSLVRNQGPIVLFVFLTLVGSAVIWLGKVWGFDIALITAIPVAMMFLYMGVNMLPGLRVHSEQTGDNLYYMGFIYTLTSLGVSLYKFTGEASIEDVVRNFGIAIISTVTGIALRIFFNQMRRDPADIEKAVRHELAEMTRRVRAELDNSAMEFSSYRRTSNQMLSEGFEEIARQAERNGEAVRTAIEAMSAKAVESIQTTSKQLLTTLEESHKNVARLSETNAGNVIRLSGQMEDLATMMTNKSTQLSEAVDNVIQKYAAARSPDEVLRIDVSPAVESLKSVADAHAKAISDNAADTRETAKKILAGIAPFKETASNLTKLAAEVTTATAAQTKSAENVAKFTSVVEEVVAVSKAANDAHAASATKLSEFVDASTGRHSEARAAEEQSRLRGERIERTLSQLSVHVPSGELPSAANDTLVDNAGSAQVSEAEDDKPRKSWWQR